MNQLWREAEMLNCLMVTVLTPTYNRVNTLPKLVDSLCRQTRTDFQWLVIDDGSPDDTEAYRSVKAAESSV